MVATYLAGLNTAQLQAVEHPAHVPLQILAGPGSGKTRVLTCRIVHLILHHGMQPSSLCAVTFTNKAAGEMRTRITKLIGQGKTDQIKMGTFHALCAKFIRRHAGKAGVRGNFTICDADESKKILKKSLKRYAEELGTIEMVPDVNFMVGKISKAKAQGLSPRDLIRDINPESLHPKDIVTRIVSKIYEEYQRTLAQNNSLDFDDLLVKGVHLFRDYPEVAAWCKHILVDEFQDTNTIQYQLMKYIAAANNCVTIVGDPDQSIYGWRSAEVENIRRMKHDFPSVACVLLEQNYRSTGAILAASVAIVAEDKDRLPKTLFTTHPTGPLPLLHQFENGRDEGQFIALEVKRIIAYTGGMLNHNDFAILLRYNSLSRTIERELQKERIPHKVLGGRKFFERMEIKDLLAYLQLVDNPEYVPAFVRIINVPPRSIGAKTVEQILAKAKQMKISPMEVVIRIHEGKIPDTKPPLKRKVTDFVDAIRLLRERAEQHCSTSILIPKLIQSIDYEEYLKKYDKDFEERWMNVEELMNFAAETETQPAHNVHMGLPPVGDDPMDDTPLRTFLQTSMLSTDSDAAEDDKTPKITIATCHAAKGLEWPVVFVPSVESGVFPAARAEDIEEERRLLYVACTRAQNYLSITHAQSRFVAGQEIESTISPFISCLEKRVRTFFTSKIPTIDVGERQLVSTILERPLVDEAMVAQKVEEYNIERRTKLNSWSDLPEHPPSPRQQPAPMSRQETELSAYQGPVVFTTAAAALRQDAPIPGPSRRTVLTKRPPLSSTSDSIVNGASSSRVQQRKPGSSSDRPSSTAKNEAQAIIDLRSPSPELVRPRAVRQRKLTIPVIGKVKGKGASPSAVSSIGSSSASMVIDLRSPSPENEIDVKPSLQLASRSKTIKADSESLPGRAQNISAAGPSDCRVLSTVPSLPAITRAKPVIEMKDQVDVKLAGEQEMAAKPATKRRLGMGRVTTGYPNKKFKTPS